MLGKILEVVVDCGEEREMNEKRMEEKETAAAAAEEKNRGAKRQGTFCFPNVSEWSKPDSFDPLGENLMALIREPAGGVGRRRRGRSLLPRYLSSSNKLCVRVW